MVASLRVRKQLAKLSFPCQNAGTAKLVVGYSRHRWTSASKRYACGQTQAKASVRVTKGIARRLRKPSRSVVASLLIKDGTTKSLPVTLPAAFRTKPTAHTAADSNFWGDSPETWCTNWQYADGHFEGTVAALAPPLWVEPPVGGQASFFWRSWLLVWDGKHNQWETPVAGQAAGTLEPTPWNSAANNPISWDWLQVSPGDALNAGEQDYTVYGGYDVYTIAAAQSATWINGQWYFSPAKFLANAAKDTSTAIIGGFCHYP